jgi:hypothetical protein
MAPPPKLQIFYYHTLVRLNTCELEVLKCLTPNIVEEKLCQLKSILFLTLCSIGWPCVNRFLTHCFVTYEDSNQSAQHKPRKTHRFSNSVDLWLLATGMEAGGHLGDVG